MLKSSASWLFADSWKFVKVSIPSLAFLVILLGDEKEGKGSVFLITRNAIVDAPVKCPGSPEQVGRPEQASLADEWFCGIYVDFSSLKTFMLPQVF